MNITFDRVYYEPAVLSYPLGKQLWEKYASLPWEPIESHNSIPTFQKAQNSEFPALKRHLILGVRKTHRYIPNQKVSDYLVPYTSSGCRAMCLYCYLVCNYNKCAYLRVFVNQEAMLKRLIDVSLAALRPLTFEIGSNSDLVLENAVTESLPLTIERFAREGRGSLTFPTKFDMVEGLLALSHGGKVIFRMSLNPAPLIRRIELGTASLSRRVDALNAMAEAGYRVGIVLAPVILLEGWKDMYSDLLRELSVLLSQKVKSSAFFEIIFMTYSYVHNAINQEAFPGVVPLLDKEKMTGTGRGKYRYRKPLIQEAEAFLRREILQVLGAMPVLYVV